MRFEAEESSKAADRDAIKGKIYYVTHYIFIPRVK